MRILLVHQNYPGQFLRIAPALEQRGHQVMALTRSDNTRQISMRHMRYQHEDINPTGPGASYMKHAARGGSAARAAQTLRDQHGFTPDVIFGHPGWGETLFLREVWPNARLLTYGEFYYGTEGRDWGFDPEFSQDNLGSRVGLISRQAHLLQALQQSDAALSPTKWQASTFPPEYRDRIHVVHDGIDTDLARPNPAARLTLKTGQVFNAGDEVLTYVGRNLEPYRGYHTFMRALPEVLARRPNAHAVIVGGDGVSYGTARADGISWKQHMLNEVGGNLDMNRVHFTGKLPYTDFISLLQISRVHAYLSYPFVLSWSLMEAMSAGCHIVGSDTPPVAEVIHDGQTGQLVDFFDVPAWSEALVAGLATPRDFDHLRTGARALIKENYDLRTVCLPKLIAFVETAGA